MTKSQITAIIQRRRQVLPLEDVLQRDYYFDMPEAEGFDSEMVDHVAQTMFMHPRVRSVEVDYNDSRGWAIAIGRRGIVLARVDIGADGAMRLSTPDQRRCER